MRWYPTNIIKELRMSLTIEYCLSSSHVFTWELYDCQVDVTKSRLTFSDISLRYLATTQGGVSVLGTLIYKSAVFKV